MANRVSATHIELAPFRYTRDQIADAAGSWLSHAPQQRELFLRFLTSSRIGARHFCIPIEQVLLLTDQKRKAEIFMEAGGELLHRVAAGILARSEIDPGSIDTVIFTSCSVPAIPSIDAALPDTVGLRPDIIRVPIYQHGCAGGIVGLSLADRLTSKNHRTLLLSVELCSLVYQSEDLTSGNLVGSAIFGDGAAAVIIEQGESGLMFIASQSTLIPNSRHLMGYNIADDGAHLTLDKSLPQELSRHAPTFVAEFLAKNQMEPGQIDWWLFHPGGVKVLQALEEALHIRPERSRWAWEVLDNYGNMSSASILFVLDRFITDHVVRDGDRICMVGVGPGLTVEVILLEYHGR